MELQSNVYTAQLDRITYPTIAAHTEDGAVLVIETNEKQRRDPQFWAAISAILKAKLWVPVSTQLHQLFDADWLVPASL
ncbi:hypothetical protein [Lacticaseibacillus daqingensis]|uniref:hypothetical protein n=1 Tax=Lacticaseibacillus daqingensis TaxID=2486014 RepID=UPI000F7798A5|nr:hypothetical protein [Lacticaseibacillus daqingensis]